MKRFANINGQLFITDETVYVSLCNPNLYYIKGIDTFEELPMPSNEDKIFTYKRKKVKIRPAFYRNGCIAILAIPEESEDSFDYYTLTVNLYEMNLMSFSSFVYVDINNEPEALDFLVENGIAEKTPFTKQNGFVEYPAISVNLLKMCSITPEKFLEMTSLIPEPEDYYNLDQE